MPQIELVSVPMNNPHWMGIKIPINNPPNWLGIKVKHNQIIQNHIYQIIVQTIIYLIQIHKYI